MNMFYRKEKKMLLVNMNFPHPDDLFSKTKFFVLY